MKSFRTSRPQGKIIVVSMRKQAPGKAWSAPFRHPAGGTAWPLNWLAELIMTQVRLRTFGLHPAAADLVGTEMPAPQFRTPLYYKSVRHPIYLGFIVAFRAAPQPERN
jgi:protein-S-isoprenylcysteine O-methyltransferase Ste14